MVSQSGASRALLRQAGPSAYVELFYFAVTLLMLLATKMTPLMFFASSAEAGVYLVVIYVWARLETSPLSPCLLFLLGLIQDVLTGAPIGLWAILFCGFFIMARGREQYVGVQGIFLSIVGFASLSAIIYAVLFLMGAIASPVRISAMAVAISYIMGLVVYLPIAFGLEVVNRMIERYREGI